MQHGMAFCSPCIDYDLIDELHFRTSAALQLISHGPLNDMEQLYIFTDGSAEDGAGWALAVIGERAGHFYLCGIAGHMLTGVRQHLSTLPLIRLVSSSCL